MRLAPIGTLMVAGVVSGWGCGDGGPQPPPPGTSTVPPETTTTAPEPPPPPPPGAVPDDYITVERAGHAEYIQDEHGNDVMLCVRSSGLLADLCYEEQTLVWDGLRNPQYAYSRCRSYLPGPWGMTPDEIAAFGQRGEGLHADMLRFIANLQKVNRRCAEQPAFCGRTDVRRVRLKAYREDALAPHLAIAGDLDGIRTWCTNLVGGGA